VTTTPAPPPTHLRDARLHKALEHAPDAHAAAPAAIREAILLQARQARQAQHAAPPPSASATAAPASPWWMRMLASPPRARRPWNAAFASVLLAGVVVGLWWDREVPGPQPDTGTRDLPAAAPPRAFEAPAPSRPPSQAPAPASTPAPGLTEAREATRPPPSAPAPLPPRRGDATGAARERMSPQADAARPQQEAAVPIAKPPQRNAAAPGAEPQPPSASVPGAMAPQQSAAAPRAMPAQSSPAAAPQRSREPQSAPAAQDGMATDAARPSASTEAPGRSSGDGLGNALRSSRIAPAPAAPSVPPAAAPPPPADADANTSLRSARQASVQPPAASPHASAWAALQVLPDAGQTRPRSAVPPDVRQAIETMLDTGPTAVPADDPVLLRILLLQSGGQPLGWLDLSSHSVRWTPANASLPRAFAARVEPALSLRVREGLAVK
jgi:hypothetical protein